MSRSSDSNGSGEPFTCLGYSGMVKAGEVPLRSQSLSISPPPTPPLPPPPSTSPCMVSRHDQIATIKRNLNFLHRATQQPPTTPPSGIPPPPPLPPHQHPTTAPSSPPKSPVIPITQLPPTRQDCCVLEPSWTTFKNHFQVSYPPPGYTKNTPSTFPCPPPPLGHLDVKPSQNLPAPIRRPSMETVESSASFEFAIEAEKMVSELCSSSKDFSEKAPAVGANRLEVCERRRHPESWSINPREVRAHDTQDYHQPPRVALNPNETVEPGVQLPCIYEDDLCLRDFIVKGCIQLDTILKGHKKNAHCSDLIEFCRMIRESAENPAAYELHHDEARSQMLTFFRLASSWLSIHPLVERAGIGREERRFQMWRYFNEWQIVTRRMMELIVKNVPALKERLDSDPKSDSLTYGDQVHKRQPLPPMHYDPTRNPMEDSLKRQRSVPNVQGQSRQWRPRRYLDNHDGENHGWHRYNPKDVNKWTIVSPEMYNQKPSNQSPFRQPDVQNPLNSRFDCQDNHSNRYRPKTHTAECIYGRHSVFTDHDKTSKWPKYPSIEVEKDVSCKMQDDGNHNNQDDVAQDNRMVLLSQIEPRFPQKHNDQQPVDLDALFQGYRVANENPEKNAPNSRQVCKVPPNQGKSRYGFHDNKVNPHCRGRRWYGNYNFCPPPWVTNAYYDQDNSDDPYDGVYMKPGSYDVPRRDQKFTAPPPPMPAPSVITTPVPARFKRGQPDEVTWQAALASAETLCKSLRSNDNQAPQSNPQQQWMIKTVLSSSNSESDVTEIQSRPGDGNEDAVATVTVAAAAAADVPATKTVSKKLKSSRERKSLSKNTGTTPPLPPPSSPTPSASLPSRPISEHHRSLSPSASRNIQKFIETVWAVQGTSRIKFVPDQEHGDVDGKKVLEDTFQRLLDDGNYWEARGAAAATAAAAASAAVGRRQNKHQ